MGWGSRVDDTRTDAVKALDYLKDMPRSKWAWEYLRRNPLYRSDHERHREGALTRHIDETGLERLRLDRPEPEAMRWGLSFFASPNRTAQTAPLAWTANVNPRVLTVVATPANVANSNTEPFELSRLSCRRICLQLSAGRETFIAASESVRVQMECTGASLLSGPVTLNFVIEGLEIDAKAEAIRRLAALYRNDAADRAADREWTSRTLMLRDGLIALDVAQAGGTHRDVARAIHGEEEAERGFSAGDEVMKRRMQRLRQKAFELMQGEFLSLVA